MNEVDSTCFQRSSRVTMRPNSCARSVTVGELVGGNTGLGYLITFGEGQANTAMVFNAIVLLTVIGILLYGAVAVIETRVLHYIPRAIR